MHFKIIAIASVLLSFPIQSKDFTDKEIFDLGKQTIDEIHTRGLNEGISKYELLSNFVNKLKLGKLECREKEWAAIVFDECVYKQMIMHMHEDRTTGTASRLKDMAIGMVGASGANHYLERGWTAVDRMIAGTYERIKRFITESDRADRERRDRERIERRRNGCDSASPSITGGCN